MGSSKIILLYVLIAMCCIDCVNCVCISCICVSSERRLLTVESFPFTFEEGGVKFLHYASVRCRRVLLPCSWGGVEFDLSWKNGVVLSALHLIALRLIFGKPPW